jgi:hypothetical protein
MKIPSGTMRLSRVSHFVTSGVKNQKQVSTPHPFRKSGRPRPAPKEPFDDE